MNPKFAQKNIIYIQRLSNFENNLLADSYLQL